MAKAVTTFIFGISSWQIWPLVKMPVPRRYALVNSNEVLKQTAPKSQGTPLNMRTPCQFAHRLDTVDSAFAVPVDAKRIESIYKKMVTGLYYFVRKAHLQRDYQYIFSHTLRSWTYREWVSMQQQGGTLICNDPRIFACQYRIVDSQPMLSRWQLLFYKAILVQVFTIPATGIEALIAEHGTDQATGIVPASTTDAEAGLP